VNAAPPPPIDPTFDVIRLWLEAVNRQMDSQRTGSRWAECAEAWRKVAAASLSCALDRAIFEMMAKEAEINSWQERLSS